MLTAARARARAGRMGPRRGFARDMLPRPRRPVTRDARGSITVEFAVLGPALVLLLLVVAVGGRVVRSQGNLDGAAADAARAASLARSPAQAASLAHGAAQADLGPTSECAAGTVRTEVSGFPPAGPAPAAAAQVRVTVDCEVDMSPFTVLGFAAHLSFTGRAVAPVDPYMCRDAPC